MKAFFGKIWGGKWLPYILYALGLAAVLPYAFCYVNNPDAYQYISIARKITAGHFSLSINGYWSPLISWIISVPLFLGIGSIAAFKLVQVLIGFFTIKAWLKLLEFFGFENWNKKILGLVIIPFVLNYAILNPTADLLFLTLLLYVLNILLQNDWMHSRRASVRLGLLGACLYFAKAFGFPLFIALLLLTILFSFFEKDKKGILRKMLPVFVVFIAMSSLWILHISIKYHGFTISKAAKFNMSKEVAPLPGQIMQLPVLRGPLLSPPDEYAISAWEAPGEMLDLTPINPIADWSYYTQIIQRNLYSIWYNDFRNQIGFIFSFMLFGFVIFRNRNTVKLSRSVLFLFFALVIIYAGYALILVHPRYIWICTWILLLLSVWMWEKIYIDKKWTNDLKRFVVILILLLAVKRPVKEILFTEDTDMPLLWIGKGLTNPFQTMSITYRPEKFLQKAVEDLKKLLDFKGNIASLNTHDGERHAYSSSLYIANEFGQQYFGPLDESLSSEEMRAQLEAFGIKYLLVWNHDAWNPANETWSKKLFFEPNLGLTVFGLF
ncbi:MAG: hypothetical protein EYC69_10655 [Bacteroidetes bacterium]|nr:MAG: hypothetical protein EYC69_10655 [Bacteroidota bacterium]